jgi:hypothetical protein
MWRRAVILTPPSVRSGTAIDTATRRVSGPFCLNSLAIFAPSRSLCTPSAALKPSYVAVGVGSASKLIAAIALSVCVESSNRSSSVSRLTVSREGYSWCDSEGAGSDKQGGGGGGEGPEEEWQLQARRLLARLVTALPGPLSPPASSLDQFLDSGVPAKLGYGFLVVRERGWF